MVVFSFFLHLKSDWENKYMNYIYDSMFVGLGRFATYLIISLTTPYPLSCWGVDKSSTFPIHRIFDECCIKCIILTGRIPGPTTCGGVDPKEVNIHPRHGHQRMDMFYKSYGYDFGNTNHLFPLWIYGNHWLLPQYSQQHNWRLCLYLACLLGGFWGSLAHHSEGNCVFPKKSVGNIK